MHNGFVNVDEEKMSKSLGNFFTVREVLPTLRHPEVLRFFVLSSHYRGPINYSLDQLEQADATLSRIYTALRDVPVVPAVPAEHSARFLASMDDDFNTPEALAVLQNTHARHEQRQGCGRGAARGATGRGAEGARAGAGSFGGAAGAVGASRQPASVAGAEPGSVAAAAAQALPDAEIESRIAARVAARQAKNWAESDRIRDELVAVGVLLEDKPGGQTVWRRA